MSFVSIVVTRNLINVMSDGKVTGINGESSMNEYKKFKQISQKQFIAFAGDKESSELIVDQVEYTKKNIYNLNDIASQISNVIITSKVSVPMAIGGLDIDGLLRVYIVSSPSGKIQKLENNSLDGLSYKFLTSPYIVNTIKQNEMENTFVNFLKNTGYNTANECQNAQKRINDFIADLDNSVNKKTFDLTIRK